LEDVIRRPLITEKNTILMEHGQYSFEVAPQANKFQIKAAVEQTFSVTVRAVNTMNAAQEVAHGQPTRWSNRRNASRLEESDRDARPW
jgi:ribosomal protein L23